MPKTVTYGLTIKYLLQSTQLHYGINEMQTAHFAFFCTTATTTTTTIGIYHIRRQQQEHF